MLFTNPFRRRRLYSGAVRPGDSEEHFRATGETISKEEEKKRKRKLKELQKRRFLESQKTGYKFGKSFHQFGLMGQQPLDFSPEQEILQRTLGGGFFPEDRIWGRDDSEPVRINNDLNPSQRGDFGTAGLFGFGIHDNDKIFTRGNDNRTRRFFGF